MTRDDVQRWLDRYVDPYDEEAVVGREAIVADWRDDQDEPGSWSAHYEPWAIDGDRAVVIGESRYTNPDGSLRTLFFNTWLLRFDDDGRCIEYVESYMELPERLRAGR